MNKIDDYEWIAGFRAAAPFPSQTQLATGRARLIHAMTAAQGRVGHRHWAADRERRTSMNDLDLISRLRPLTDAEAAGLVSESTRADLARQITGQPGRAPARARRHSRRWLIATSAAVSVAAAALAVTTLASLAARDAAPRAEGPATRPIQAEALSFVRDGSYIDVIIRDPFADPGRYQAEFRARGLNITLRMIPVSPSLVGTVIEYEGDPGITPIIVNGGCRTGGAGGACPAGLRIPADYRGAATLNFGRAARPGEQYQSAAAATAPGEALYGTHVNGQTVSAVLAILTARHLRPVFDDVAATGKAQWPAPGQVPGTWYVYSADPWAPGQILLSVGKTQAPTSPPPAPDAPVPMPAAG